MCYAYEYLNVIVSYGTYLMRGTSSYCFVLIHVAEDKIWWSQISVKDGITTLNFGRDSLKED